MRVMARVDVPVDSGNEGIRSGVLPKTIQQFAERWHPEAAYFTVLNGQRTAYFVFDMPDSSAMPSIAEPFFMELNARVELAPVMSMEDLQKGLSEIG